MIHLLVAVTAAAFPAPAALDYQAPSGCPTASAFKDAIAARGGDLAAPSSPGEARMLVVSIRKQADGYAGAFQVREPEGVTGARQLRGVTCAEVADALAVVAAIELRGEAGDTRAAPAPISPVASDPPAPPDPPAGAPDAPAPRDRLRGHTQVFPPRHEVIRVGAGDLKFDLSRGVSLGVGATVGLVPATWLPTYRLASVLASFVTTPEGAARISGPVLGLHVDYLGNGTYTSADTKTVANGVAFGFYGCQAPFYDTGGLTLLVCGELGGGVLALKTQGQQGVMIQSKSAGFGTAAAVVDVGYNLLGAGFVSLRVSGGINLGDITAERADGSRIFGPSRWSASATLSVGLRF
jgi:hypothetical protein